MALAQEYSLQGIRLTGQIDFDKLQFQATIDTAQKTQDRNAQTMVSMYNGLLEYSKVIDTTVGFKAETKAALKNEAYVKISEALNTLTNSKSLNIAEILQPPETGKTAGYIKGTSFANLNDLAFTANKWGADFYSKKWTDLTDAQVSEIEKNKNKSPYWKEMVRSLDANSFASLKAPVTPVSPETAATINS